MPIPNGMPMDFKDTLNKVIMLFGIIIIIYAILWILAKLNLIPSIIFGIFPQIVLLLVGVFIFYYAWNSRNKMY